MSLHDEKILVWFAISTEGIIGSYFFFEESVNKENYLETLKILFWHRHVQRLNSANYYFQQDGGTSHTAHNVQKWLNEKFSNRFMDKKKWPPRSPYLNPCDFYLWGYLKSVVYNPLPKKLDDLKANIEREIRKKVESRNHFVCFLYIIIKNGKLILNASLKKNCINRNSVFFTDYKK